MAERLVHDIFNGEADHQLVLNAIKNGSLIKVNHTDVTLSEFIPYFLTFLREKLTPVMDTSSVYCSPRQIEEKRKQSTKKVANTSYAPKQSQTKPIKKTARISLQYSSSSPAKTVVGSYEKEDSISGISPIKSTRKTPPHRKHVNSNRKLKTSFISPTQGSPKVSDGFELSSFDDFPSIALSTKTKKKPRRITATPVQNSLQNSFTNTKSDTSSVTSFLEESNFETQNADNTSSNHSLFTDHARFTNPSSTFDDSVFGKDIEQSSNGFDEGFGAEAFGTEVLNVSSNMTLRTPTKETDTWSMSDITNHKLLDVFIDIYSTICLQNLVPNLTLELYFLFVTLTCTSKRGQTVTFHFPFVNIQCCVYFASKCLEHMIDFVALLDMKILQLLHDNQRLKIFSNEAFHKQLDDVITCDINDDMKRSLVIKSPMTGIPFQVESDNRKSFLSDKHFYCFSKKRDAFYSLVREWEENHLDPDWNVVDLLSVKVPELMKMSNGINIHYQHAKLFVKQLLEMCRNCVGSKTDDANTSDSVLLELKKSNPSKFQNLQDRLTRPSVSHDLCPKPSFSMVENFFKQFIIIADAYCFSKYLAHILLEDIIQINSKTFGLDFEGNQVLNKSDIAESLWQDIKTAISELRLLAKFLGFVIFLPYNVLDEQNGDLQLSSREKIVENLNLTDILLTSYRLRRLLITVPWVVDFFSMADKNAIKLDVYKQPLLLLASFLPNQTIHIKRHSLINFVISNHIGWLLEQPCAQTINIYDKDVLTYDLNQEFVGKFVLGIDDIIEPDKLFLYTLCPYLNDIKKPLVDFSKGNGGYSSSGSFRKITPVRTSDAFSVDMKHNIQVQLIDNFLKYQPNYVQDCIKFVTESKWKKFVTTGLENVTIRRHVSNMKQHISSVIIKNCSEKVLENIKENFNDSLDDDSDVTLDSLKEKGTSQDVDVKNQLHNYSIYSTELEEGRRIICKQCNKHLISYLHERAEHSIKTILPESSPEKVVTVASQVIKYNVRLKIQEWLIANRDLYTTGLDSLYHKYIKSVIKQLNQDRSVS